MATATEYHDFINLSLTALAQGKTDSINFTALDFDDQQSVGTSALKAISLRFQEITRQNDIFAKGINKLEITALSENDTIYNSFQRIYQMQSEMIDIMQDVSVGNFDITVKTKDQADELGKALALIIENLGSITDQAVLIARGDYRTEIKPKSNKDQLGNALFLMTQSLRNIGEVAEGMALGDFTNKVEVKGENDLLAKAMNKMVDSLNQLTVQADNIALGNLTEKIVVKGDQDKLSIAMNRMASNFVNITQQAKSIAAGDFSQILEAQSENDQLAIAMNTMLDSLRKLTTDAARENWIKTGFSELAELMRGDLNIEVLTEKVIAYLAKYTDSRPGIFYLADEARNLTLAASYAYKRRKNLSASIAPGEGLVGQAVKEKQLICISNIPEDYITVSSGLGEAPPNNIVVLPLVVEGSVKGAIELGSFGEYNDMTLELFERLSESIAVAINSASDRVKMQDLLEEAQRTSEELQSQQTELKASNEELEQQTEIVKESEAELKTQQEELQASNEELEEKTQYLEKQRAEIQSKNQSIEKSRAMLEEKASDLELSSKYKSEFLANMSHELRTPLNSLLILAKMLADNKEGNLNDKQVKSAKIIQNGGNDLLELINDILDLSKVEAGQMTLNIDHALLSFVKQDLENKFSPLALDKPFEFKLEFAPDLPQSFETDIQRTSQVLKNLLSNAFKFTREGKVILQAFLPPANTIFKQPHLTPGNSIAFAVTDTGIGIAPEKLRSIFEAFQQADGSTSRDYGGTGLGLTISRNLSNLMGGEIQVQSETEKGSTFTLYLPLYNDGKYAERSPLGQNNTYFSATKNEQSTPQPSTLQPSTISNSYLSNNANLPDDLQTSSTNAPASTGSTTGTSFESGLNNDLAPVFIPDDRNDIKPDSLSILIIEDDRDFASVLSGIAHDKDYLCLNAGDGKSALQLAHQYKPSAILLDLGLPDIDGTRLLNMFKQDLATRHIPIHVITGREDSANTLNQGAVGILHKPTSADQLESVFITLGNYIEGGKKHILIVEDDDQYRNTLIRLLGHQALSITECKTGEKALELISETLFDCIILDLVLPDISGKEVLRRLSDANISPLPPIIVNTGKELSPAEFTELNRYTNEIVIKGANSTNRLLDEVTLFLHQSEASLPKSQRSTLKMLHDDASALNGHTILMVDDDLRNTFAISNLLEEHGLNIIIAENGQLALDSLNEHPEIDLVLMDIMMPVMNGYEAMEKIRQQEKYKTLPIIALTAKAMAEDRAKCLEAGANDYMNKPLDSQKLINLLKVSIQ
ncbi:MAG: response regulator [Pseudomonadales bacterium]|nr:response regulator [Pseudomonadales bacterium]